MSKAQDSLPTSNAKPASPDPVPGHSSAPVAMAHGEAWGEPGMDDGAGSGGHTLLSRPSLPQGRRSLFRR
jgi:hypothetical protein